ncbi:MAG: cytochrome c [Bacillus sp. (in: Bacteria)]|nr:cytochrome c [Bacillus sp. (in: firmicutes)]
MLAKNKLMLFVAVLVTMLLLAACGGGDDSASNGESGSSNGGDVTASSEGEEVYMQSCAACHGQNLEGANAVALTGLTLSKEEIVEITLNGQGAMPGGLADGKEEEVAEYILSQQ